MVYMSLVITSPVLTIVPVLTVQMGAFVLMEMSLMVDTAYILPYVQVSTNVI